MKTCIKLLVLAMAASTAAIAADPITTTILNEGFLTPAPSTSPYRPNSNSSQTWYSSVGFSVPNSGLSQYNAGLRFRTGGYVVTQFNPVSIANVGDSLKLSFNVNTTNAIAQHDINAIRAGLFDSTNSGTATPAQIANNTWTGDSNPSNLTIQGLYAEATYNATTTTTESAIRFRNSSTPGRPPFVGHGTHFITDTIGTTAAEGFGGNGWLFELTLTHVLVTGIDRTQVDFTLTQTGAGGAGEITSMSFSNMAMFTFDTLAIDIGRFAGFADVGSIKLEQTIIPEPTTYAAALGLLALVAVFIYRRHNKQ